MFWAAIPVLSSLVLSSSESYCPWLWYTPTHEHLEWFMVLFISNVAVLQRHLSIGIHALFCWVHLFLPRMGYPTSFLSCMGHPTYLSSEMGHPISFLCYMGHPTSFLCHMGHPTSFLCHMGHTTYFSGKMGHPTSFLCHMGCPTLFFSRLGWPITVL